VGEILSKLVFRIYKGGRVNSIRVNDKKGDSVGANVLGRMRDRYESSIWGKTQSISGDPPDKRVLLPSGEKVSREGRKEKRQRPGDSDKQKG